MTTQCRTLVDGTEAAHQPFFTSHFCLTSRIRNFLLRHHLRHLPRPPQWWWFSVLNWRWTILSYPAVWCPSISHRYHRHRLWSALVVGAAAAEHLPFAYSMARARATKMLSNQVPLKRWVLLLQHGTTIQSNLNTSAHLKLLGYERIVINQCQDIASSNRTLLIYKIVTIYRTACLDLVESSSPYHYKWLDFIDGSMNCVWCFCAET